MTLVPRWSIARLLWLCAISALLWGAVATACLCFGSTSAGWPAGEILTFRLHAVLDASLIGGALAAAGCAYQAILRNPLAEPGLLGVSSGAALAVYLWTLPSIALWPFMETAGEQVVSFAGAMAALGIVFFLAQRRGRLETVTLILVGVIVNAICGAVFLLIVHLNLHSDRSSAQSGGPFRFLVGGINTNLTLQEEWTAFAIIAAMWLLLLSLTGQLNAAMLGEAEAHALGVRVQRLRWTALVAGSLAAAAAVALSGPIAFVGLVCPHLGRLIVGSDQRRLLPVATMLGAALLAIADTVSRRISATTYGPLPVGVLTSMLGGPFFLYLLWRNRHHKRIEGFE